jgi:hypothetical protein
MRAVFSPSNARADRRSGRLLGRAYDPDNVRSVGQPPAGPGVALREAPCVVDNDASVWQALVFSSALPSPNGWWRITAPCHPASGLGWPANPRPQQPERVERTKGTSGLEPPRAPKQPQSQRPPTRHIASAPRLPLLQIRARRALPTYSNAVDPARVSATLRNASRHGQGAVCPPNDWTVAWSWAEPAVSLSRAA